jgi:hypothetical protein
MPAKIFNSAIRMLLLECAPEVHQFNCLVHY